MATQSLYRRYRPRRFSEVKGQQHVVQALRNAVAEGREGQAYLFSGPRGTGKTTSARILAKVLNCTNPSEGEPCCECESCLSVERGTSYDVHELDAASNNGVDAMRDLIEKAALGTPGRHKVYILDEVHMLSKAAEAALLKTLEEPPAHVVFVLATTDPQKMSDTIRSRTQHLQFHLLPADTLQEHIRWVADDAGLDVTDEALQQVLDRGAGSARDTLSALELVANSGGSGAETVPLGRFVEAMIDADAGGALTMIAGAISLGQDPRTLTEALIGHLRNGFLSLMAPELVQLPSNRVEELTEQARRLGPAGLVRGIEQLGDALAEMRHAPDARVLLDVAAIRLTSPDASSDLSGVVARLGRLEQAVADGVPAAGRRASAEDRAAPAEPAPEESAPVDPPTGGRARLGARARRGSGRSASAESRTVPPADVPADLPAERPTDERAGAAPAVIEKGEPASETSSSRTAESANDAPSTDRAPERHDAETPTGDVVRTAWEETVRPALRGMPRALYTPAEYVSSSASGLTLQMPNAVHRDKCEQHRAAVEEALASAVGAPVTIELTLDGGSAPSGAQAPASTPSGAPAAGRRSPDSAAPAGQQPTSPSPVDRIEPPSDSPTSDGAEELPHDDDVDLDGLVDAPPDSVKTPIDRLAEAFPGSELVEDQR